MYSYIPAGSCCVVGCCRCSSSCAGWQYLLLWFTASDSSVFFLFIQTRYIFNVALGSTVAFTALIRRLKYIQSTYHTSSVLRACAETRQVLSPPRRSPPGIIYVYIYYLNVRQVCISLNYQDYELGKNPVGRQCPACVCVNFF